MDEDLLYMAPALVEEARLLLAEREANFQQERDRFQQERDRFQQERDRFQQERNQQNGQFAAREARFQQERNQQNEQLAERDEQLAEREARLFEREHQQAWRMQTGALLFMFIGLLMLFIGLLMLLGMNPYTYLQIPIISPFTTPPHPPSPDPISSVHSDSNETYGKQVIESYSPPYGPSGKPSFTPVSSASRGSSLQPTSLDTMARKVTESESYEMSPRPISDFNTSEYQVPDADPSLAMPTVTEMKSPSDSPTSASSLSPTNGPSAKPSPLPAATVSPGSVPVSPSVSPRPIANSNTSSKTSSVDAVFSDSDPSFSNPSSVEAVSSDAGLNVDSLNKLHSSTAHPTTSENQVTSGFNISSLKAVFFDARLWLVVLAILMVIFHVFLYSMSAKFDSWWCGEERIERVVRTDGRHRRYCDDPSCGNTRGIRRTETNRSNPHATIWMCTEHWETWSWHDTVENCYHWFVVISGLVFVLVPIYLVFQWN